MKTIKSKITINLIITAVLMMAVSACKKDEVVAPTNFFTVDGASRNITIAALSYRSTPITSALGKTTYRNDLALGSDGLTLTGNRFTGKGDAINLSINAATQTLDEGSYVFTGTELNPEPLQVREAITYLSYDPTTQLGDQLKFTAASLVVTKSGTTYTIKLTGTAGGKAIVAQYTGAVTTVAR
jgi:hypothetical protein